MPYIALWQRSPLDDIVAEIKKLQPMDPGELNYLITQIVQVWLSRTFQNYAAYSAARGVLADVGEELYRRVMAPYEDKKCQENGDVYDNLSNQHPPQSSHS